MIRKSNFKSRKFVIVLIGMFLSTTCFLVLDRFPISAPQFPTFVGAIMGLAGLYLGGNVSALHVATRNAKEDVPAPEDK